MNLEKTQSQSQICDSSEVLKGNAGVCRSRGLSLVSALHPEECSGFAFVLPAPAAGGQSPLLGGMSKSLGRQFLHIYFFCSVVISVPFLPFVLYLILLIRKREQTKENSLVTLEGCCALSQPGHHEIPL